MSPRPPDHGARPRVVALTCTLLVAIGLAAAPVGADLAAAAPAGADQRLGTIGSAWEPLGEPSVGGQVTSLSISPHDPSRVLVGGDMLGAGLSTDGGDSWGPTTGFVSWELAEFTWHPHRPFEVWAATMSGPHVSTDGGRTWELRRDGFPAMSSHHYSAPVEQVLFDPTDADRLLAVGGSQRLWHSTGTPRWGAVWESTDSGRTWGHLSDVRPGANVTGAAYLDDRTILASVAHHGVYRSTDSGRSWSPVNSGLDLRDASDIAVHPSDGRTAWVSFFSANGSTPGGVYRTTDGGGSWSPAGSGLPRIAGRSTPEASNYAVVEVAPGDGDVVYTADRRWDRPRVYRSTDGGRRWAEVAHGTRTFYSSGITADALTVSPHTSEVVLVAQSEFILRSTDGGHGWTDVSSRRVGDGWRGTGFSGLVAKGASFNPARPGELVLAAMDGGHTLHSRDGVAWDRDRGGWGGAHDVDHGRDHAAWVLLGQHGTFGGVTRSVDGGATLSAPANDGLPATGSGRSPRSIVAIDRSTALVAVDGRVYRTADGGRRWSVVLDDTGTLADSPQHPNVVVLAGRRGVHRSADAGRTWTPMPGSPAQGAEIVVDPHDPSRLWVTVYKQAGAGLHRYDGRWTRLRDAWHTFGVAVSPADPGTVVVTQTEQPYRDRSVGGVLVSRDGGATFSEWHDGLAMTRAEVIAFDPHDPARLVLGTQGRGFWTARLSTADGSTTPSPPTTAPPASEPPPTTAPPAPGAPPTTVRPSEPSAVAPSSGPPTAHVEVPANIHPGTVLHGEVHRAGATPRLRWALQDLATGTWLRRDGSWGRFETHAGSMDGTSFTVEVADVHPGRYGLSLTPVDSDGVRVSARNRTWEELRVTAPPTTAPPTTAAPAGPPRTRIDISATVAPGAVLSGEVVGGGRSPSLRWALRDQDRGLWLRPGGGWGDYAHHEATMDGTTFGVDLTGVGPGSYGLNLDPADSTGEHVPIEQRRWETFRVVAG